jgi:endonuclease/exonuclease/phosphatase family metal-dependent hydrolase
MKPMTTVHLRLAAVGAVLFSAACASLRHEPRPVPLRVMSYNIRSGNGNLDGTAAAIRASEPDIVALQEVDVHWAERSSFVDQARGLGKSLEMEVRFARIYQLRASSDTSPPREFGVALLSRYPIIRWANDSLTRLSTQEPDPVPERMPGLLEAVVSVRGIQVRVFNTHLDYRSDPRVRRMQVSEMLNYVASRSMPTIVCGDMNAKPDAAELRPLRDRLTDAWTGSAEQGKTYPAEQPNERIDYIFVSHEFRVRSTAVPVTLASDHRPVVADLLLDRRD